MAHWFAKGTGQTGWVLAAMLPMQMWHHGQTDSPSTHKLLSMHGVFPSLGEPAKV